VSLNKWKKCIYEVFDKENCEILEIKQSKKHLKAYVVLPSGTKRMFVTSITPSDKRKCLLNFRGDIRREIKNERTNS